MVLQLFSPEPYNASCGFRLSYRLLCYPPHRKRFAMPEKKCCCCNSEKAEKKPEECTPEQIQECHGDEQGHPCAEASDNE